MLKWILLIPKFLRAFYRYQNSPSPPPAPSLAAFLSGRVLRPPLSAWSMTFAAYSWNCFLLQFHQFPILLVQSQLFIHGTGCLVLALHPEGKSGQSIAALNFNPSCLIIKVKMQDWEFGLYANQSTIYLPLHRNTRLCSLTSQYKMPCFFSILYLNSYTSTAFWAHALYT